MNTMILIEVGFLFGIGFAMGCSLVGVGNFWLGKAGEITGKALASYFNKRS